MARWRSACSVRAGRTVVSGRAISPSERHGSPGPQGACRSHTFGATCIPLVVKGAPEPASTASSPLSAFAARLRLFRGNRGCVTGAGIDKDLLGLGNVAGLDG